ARVWHA
nr:Chain B, peptide ketoamide inhibitor [Drosophila melanogaster]